MANEVTLKGGIDTSNIPVNKAIRSEEPVPQVFKQQSKTPSQQQRPVPPTPAATDAGATDIVSEAAAQSHAESAANDSGARSELAFQKLQLHMSSSTHDEDEVAMSSPRFAATPAETPASQMSEADDRYIMPDDMPPYDPNLDISMDTGVNSNAVQPSVTNSNSTIMHTNLSADQFMKRELNRHLAREEKKEESLPSDTDWLDKMVRTNDTVGTTTVECDRTNAQTITFPALLLLQGMPMESPSASEQVEKDNVKAALEQERARQIALVAKAKEHTARDQENNNQSDLMKAAAAKKSLKDAGTIYKNNSGVSGVSLDYSVDSHSYLAGDGSTLLGGKFAADSSVLSGSSTKGSSQSSSLKLHAQQRTKQDPLAMPNQMANPRDEDEKSGFSIQESSSSMEVIPSDEDLFAVGWAKALDPRSGSYYYFTLDRAKIVWDNPLAPAHDTSMEEDDETAADDTSSLPRGAIAI